MGIAGFKEWDIAQPMALQLFLKHPQVRIHRIGRDIQVQTHFESVRPAVPLPIVLEIEERNPPLSRREIFIEGPNGKEEVWLPTEHALKVAFHLLLFFPAVTTFSNRLLSFSIERLATARSTLFRRSRGRR